MRLSRVPTLALLLVAAAVGSADPPPLEIPAEVKPTGSYVVFTPKTTAKAVTYVGLDGIDPAPSTILKDPRQFYLPTYGLPAGRYRFAAVGSLNDEHTRTDFVVVVGTPPPPPSPGPGPTPTPPGPTPAANPFGTTDGLRVLIVYEKTDSSKLTRDQVNTIYGKDFYDYLNAKCPAGVGGQKTWRVWDKDVQAAADEDPAWAVGMARPRQSVPWILIGNGAAGFEGPLPATKADITALLKKFGG